MRPRPARFLSIAVSITATTAVLAACTSNSNNSNAANSSNTSPILIGASLSLTGDFSADGQAFLRGYRLWQSDVNSHGGLLGRPVKLIILNDGSSPTAVVADCQKLIAVNHVALTFGAFSSLLTQPASAVAAQHGYAMVNGAGSTDNVFDALSNKVVRNVFSPSLPVDEYMKPFVDWIKSLPPSQRPKTAAYPMISDPFADPPVQFAQKELQALGIKTVYSKVLPTEPSAYKPAADQVAASGAQMVVLGSPDVPSVSAFMQAFQQQKYNPKVFICASGPDQGTAFLSAVGKANATGIMVPNGWYGAYNNPLSNVMVKEYIAKYGGTASAISADVAEAYSVGEVVADAVKATHGTDNKKIIQYLHSGVTLNTVQGAAHFAPLGRNTANDAAAFIFQWRNGSYKQVLPLHATGSHPIIYPKPNWGR
jgi:branched-chain amino acid transport system substrate-binding protein